MFIKVRDYHEKIAVSFEGELSYFVRSYAFCGTWVSDQIINSIYEQVVLRLFLWLVLCLRLV